MLVSSLEIENFRNLHSIVLQCSPGLNIIIGKNASGKTSLLEALYFLGRGRSFRTRRIHELIRRGETTFRIVARLSETEGGVRIPVGIQRSCRNFIVRINGEPAQSLAQLAIQVPVLLLNPDSHRLLEGGPQHRRRFMDWGLFYAEPEFWAAWKRYGIVLRNRNAALRAHYPDRTIDIWDKQLVAMAVILDDLRNVFCHALHNALKPLVQETLALQELEVDYQRGWSQEKEGDLMELLHRNRGQDRHHGYTRIGPHRADFKIKLAGRPITEQLSRGQQKLLVIALMLAQASLYREKRGSSCILLIDDLPAELDQVHKDRILNCLTRMNVQLFVTAIEKEAFGPAKRNDIHIFKIDHGAISNML
jgi:DNA replication and repair protein RecF